MTVEDITESDKSFCACGCGTLIGKTDRRGRSHSFVSGHNSHLKTINPVKTNLIKCLCGCGELLLDKDNRCRKIRYKFGHDLKFFRSKLKGEETYNWKGGRYFGNDGYIHVKSEGHPRVSKSKPYVTEHSLIMEKYLSDLLGIKIIISSQWAIHHKNEIKTDNRLENLCIMTRAQHQRHHNYKRMLGFVN